MWSLLVVCWLRMATGLVPSTVPRDPATRRRAEPTSTLLLSATELVQIEKVGPEVYKPIFLAGLGIVGIALFSVAAVALIVESTDTFESRAADFRATGNAQLEAEFGAETVQQAKAGLLTKETEARSEIDPDDLYAD